MMSSNTEQTLGVDDRSLDSSKSPKPESSLSSRRPACKEGGGSSRVRSASCGAATTPESYLHFIQTYPSAFNVDDPILGDSFAATVEPAATPQQGVFEHDDMNTVKVSIIPGDTPFLYPDIQETNFTKYWKIKPTQQRSLTNENILTKVNALRGCYHSIKPTRGGDLLVQVSSKTMADKLMTITQIGNTPVQITGNNYLNCSKGVVSSSEFEGISDTDLDSIFSSVAVEVKRFNKKSGTAYVPSNSILITFKNSVLPKAITFGYMTFKVKPYFPKPIRCFNCQRYGHTNSQHRNSQHSSSQNSNSGCRRSRTCGRCAVEEEDHDFDHC